MAKNVTHMHVPSVRDFAKQFDMISNVLKGVNTALEGALTLLKTTAFIGAVGGAAIIHMIETVKPPIEKMAALCAELSQDATKAADEWEQLDAQIAA